MENMYVEDVRVPGQDFVVITTTTENRQIPGVACAVCVRGMFSNLEAAQEHAKRIQASKCKFNTYIGHANAWFGVPPEEKDIKQVYGDEKLDQIMHAEEDSRKRAHDSYHKRLREMKKLGKDYSVEDWVQEVRPASEMDL